MKKFLLNVIEDESLFKRLQDDLVASGGRVDGLAEDEALHDDTRLWAALQKVGGGTWGGCVYDVEKIVETLEAGTKALSNES